MRINSLPPHVWGLEGVWCWGGSRNSVKLSYFVRLGKCGRMGNEHPIYCPPTLWAASAKFLCNASGRGISLTDGRQHCRWIRAVAAQIICATLSATSCAFHHSYITSLGWGSRCQNLGLQTHVINCRTVQGISRIHPTDSECIPFTLISAGFYLSFKLAAGLIAISMQNI